jgi:hypothetical protein
MKYNWEIINTIRNPETGYINSVDWEIEAEDGDIFVEYSGTIEFKNTEQSELIIPYTQVTKETIIDWIENSTEMENIKSILLDSLEERKKPQPISGLPWD